MKIISIKKSSFSESDFRIDAAYHLSDGPLAKKQLNNSPYSKSKLIEESIKIYSGSIFKRSYVSSEDFGWSYLTGSNMIKLNIDSGKFISKKYTPQSKSLKIEEGWILISCSGTLGNTVFTNKDFDGKLGTHDLIRVIPNENKTLRGYLYAYLSSYFGHSLLTQSSYGGVVKHIEPHHIENLPIPILPRVKQVEINNLILKSAALSVEANKLLSDAIHLIISSMEVKMNSNKKSTLVSLSRLSNNYHKRLDSPSYINSGVISLKELENNGVGLKKIGDFDVEVARPGIFKRVKVKKENGLPYIKGAELTKRNPFGLCEYLSKTRTPFLDELKLNEDQILFTCAGTVGFTRLITKEFEERNAIGSQDIIRLYSKDSELSNHFLFAYLNTPIIKDFIQSLKYGSVIERVEPLHVELIPVFMPPKDIRIEIEEKISSYCSKIYSSFKKEEKAIQIVEKEIESWQK